MSSSLFTLQSAMGNTENRDC